MYERPYIHDIKARVLEPRQFMQVIVGPRQVGKTTLMMQVLAQCNIESIYESADAIGMSGSAWLLQVWESARVKLRTTEANELLLVIDEIQKIENWSEFVKQQWDMDTQNELNIKVIVLGSSRLLIQKGLTESLAGRFETIYLPHWSFTEMHEAFGWSLDQYIYFGGYPGSAKLIDDEKRWKNYVQNSLLETSISKDILMLTRIDKPALLRRLFEIGSLYSGQILSFTKIMGVLNDAGNTTTLSNYLKLLNDCGLLTGLEKYSGNVIRKRSSQPKFQVHNNALITAQTNTSFETLRTTPKEWGRLVESAIGAHLVNYGITERYNIAYWREANAEVDFVIQNDNKIVGIEVKSSQSAQTTTGMSIFNEKFKPEKVLLVGFKGIPIDEFLKMNPKDLL